MLLSEPPDEPFEITPTRGYHKEVADTTDFLTARFGSYYLSTCSKQVLTGDILSVFLSLLLYKIHPFLDSPKLLT